jgi:hypothetical protein
MKRNETNEEPTKQIIIVFNFKKQNQLIEWINVPCTMEILVGINSIWERNGPFDVEAKIDA